MIRLPQSQLAPESLFDAQGLPTFGHFDGIVRQLDIDAFKYFTTMDKPASAVAKHFDFKQFQFISVVTPRYVLGIALADIRYVGSAFCYVYDILANRLSEIKWLKPFGFGYQMTASPWDGHSHIGGKRASIRFDIQQGQWGVAIDSERVQAKLTFVAPPLSLPMAMCNPTGYNGWTYTQKHNGLSVKGKLTIEGEPQPLNHALAGYDFSAGFMRRDTSWRWASINARIEEGVMGLNLAAGVNETGCSENVFWINGERHLLGAVHFQFQRHDAQANQPWRIVSDNGQVQLTFSPSNCRSEKLNLLFLKSNFRQYLGCFSGQIIDNQGRIYQLNQVLGLTEDHYARW